MRLSRRSLLGLGLGVASLAGAALVGCGGKRDEAKGHAPPAPPAPAPRPANAAPRSLVLIFLRGGIDAMYTTDPKLRADVDDGIDVPFAEREIVSAGRQRVGPHLAALSAFLPRMTLVNGIRVNTANHETGAAQVLRQRTGVLPAMPGLLDIIGARRDGQPLGSVSLGQFNRYEHGQRWFSEEQLKLLDAIPGPEQRRVAEALRAQVPAYAGGRDGVVTGENLGDAAAFLERYAQVRPFAYTPDWQPEPLVARVTASLQQALWLLEHDLTKCIFVKAYLPWDTHERNALGQGNTSKPFFPMLARFLGELDKRRGPHGVLADTTRVVMTSEVGRFPRLNGDLGKDHFPELPMLFYGPRLAAGATFGRTGRSMESLPVSVKTGAPTTDGTVGHVPTLDDVGATLLHDFGVEPRSRGYTGRVLDFLGVA